MTVLATESVRGRLQNAVGNDVEQHDPHADIIGHAGPSLARTPGRG